MITELTNIWVEKGGDRVLSQIDLISFICFNVFRTSLKVLQRKK